MIEFGRNHNQISHTFRHTDAEGLEQADVELAILKALQAVQAVLAEGAYTGHVAVKGVHLEFRAYKFSDGNVHVGRITPR